MSTKVMAWVWEHSTASNAALLLHLAMADEARDDGYLSGKEYGSTARLESKCNFGSRQTIVEARDWLETHSQILVCRPSDRGYGRHNEYVVLMDRDPRTVAEGLGWRIPRLQSEPQTIVLTTSPARASAPFTSTTRSTAIVDLAGAHRGTQAAPSATCGNQATAPVETLSAPSEKWSGIQTEQFGRPVQDRSRTGLLCQTLPSTPTEPKTNHLHITLAHETSGGWAPVDGDEDPDAAAVTALRSQLASLAPELAGVDWTMTAGRRSELVAHMSTWPTLRDAVDEWTEAALVAVERFGVPRYARAWRTLWLELTPPGPLDGEAMCTEHVVDGYPPLPVRVCVQCRQSAAS